MSFRSHTDFISKRILYEINLIIKENEHSLAYRKKQTKNNPEQFKKELELLNRLGAIHNPFKARKILELIKFAFEFDLYATDENWTRRQLIKNELEKNNISFVYAEREKVEGMQQQYKDIIEKIDVKLRKKVDKGRKLFIKHYNSLNLIKINGY